MGSSEEDDYMSDNLLATINDVKPGIQTSRHQQRYLKIMANRDAAEGNFKKPMKKYEIEKNLLEEGLNQPICSQSKGFSLLAKLGYKPGMSLGKKREGEPEGIKEPIVIEFKTGRSGLGHELHEKEKQKERCEMHLEQMSRRAKNEEVLAEDFRYRKRLAVVQKQLIGDIFKTRKACQELDIRLGKNVPECEWYWPIYKNKEKEERLAEASLSIQHQIKRKRLKHEFFEDEQPTENEEIRHFYANGGEAPEEINFYELDESELQFRLGQLVSYVRETHCYCVWCGSSYETLETLKTQCPGETREEHDDHDD